jgi:hypothetical protein
MDRRASSAAESAALVERVLAARERVRSRLSDIDPGDLLVILQSLLRPPGSRHFLLRPAGPHSYAP